LQQCVGLDFAHLTTANLLCGDVSQNVENKYKLEVAKPFILNDYPEYITFKTPDPVKFPIYISLQIEARFGPWIVRISMGALLRHSFYFYFYFEHLNFT